MNERIKELWEQCKTPNWHQDNPTYDHEKFAELIIRECTKLIEESTEDDEYWSRVTGAESIMAIEEHFGVGE